MFEALARAIAPSVADRYRHRATAPGQRRDARRISPAERAALDQLAAYLADTTSGLEPGTRLVQIVVTGATLVGDMYWRWYPAPLDDVAWRMDPATHGGATPSGVEVLAARLTWAALTAESRDGVVPQVVEVLRFEQPARVRDAAVELAKTYGLMLMATRS